MAERLAVITYETPFAPCGGVAAVVRFLPPALQLASNRATVVVSPYHHLLPRMQALAGRMERLGTVSVRYREQTISVQVLRYLDQTSWIFLLPDDDRYFAGQRHPYDVFRPDTSIVPGANPLLRDSLLFGIAAVKALHILAPGDKWTLLLQDWEAATAALPLAGRATSHQCWLTLHNSYDCHTDDEDLLDFGLDPAVRPGRSVLQRVQSVVGSPLLTVSRQFGLELTEDLQQRLVLAPHLQTTFVEKGLSGIDNGPFVKLAVPADVLQTARAGNLEALHAWKVQRREALGKALQELQRDIASGKNLPWGTTEPPWGHLDRFVQHFQADDGTPWFVMGGRDDSRQKGYDLAAQAAQQYLATGGKGRFLFFPMPSDEGHAGLKFLQELAEREPYGERVLIFPFFYPPGYMAAMQGATFGLMPSLYEPFGAANEFYLNGTVGIGRATGGIVQQIVPWKRCESHNLFVSRRAKAWHADSAPPTGLLFREPDLLETAEDDWHGINEGAYNLQGGHPNRVTQRRQFPLFEAMAHALGRALDDASRLYQHERKLYYQMLLAGIDHIQTTFSWERAAQEYLTFIDRPAPPPLRKL